MKSVGTPKVLPYVAQWEVLCNQQNTCCRVRKLILTDFLRGISDYVARWVVLRIAGRFKNTCSTCAIPNRSYNLRNRGLRDVHIHAHTFLYSVIVSNMITQSLPRY